MDLDSVKSFRLGLKKNKKLEILEMNECNLSNSNIHYICDSILENQILKSFSIQSNYFTSPGFSSISKLIQRTKSLNSINLNGNIPGGCLKEYFESLKLNETITELHMDKFELSKHPSGFRWVYDYFKNKKYKILEIGNNGFNENSMIYISKLLKFNPYIEHFIFNSIII